MSAAESPVRFDHFGLSPPLLRALDDVGYETASPIQQQCIPLLLAGHDIIGQAQTGTGKTAAFALPLLHRIDIRQRHPQLLVLTPTRELAIQVAEAIQSYAHHLRGFHVLPIYGGQSYDLQLKPLKRGVHVVVGTPGRIMDHIQRGTLQLGGLAALVLDEADEMLRMGFIDDIQWVMGKIPEQRQIALFSATMPAPIQRVAEKFLRQPRIVRIESKTTTATSIRQRYWLVSRLNKLDALTRLLEVEPFDALLLFVRTKTATLELADKLAARGFAAEAINGDIAQKSRERLIERLKKGKIDILVATDVAARGLDVERISLVINYDIPHDPESYVHRIGRTGRAGRKGEAILFVAPREKRMLKSIERVTRQPIEAMQLPSTRTINRQRIRSFKQKITDTLGNQDLGAFEKLVQEYHQETGVEPLKIAAALAQLSQGQAPLLLTETGSSLPRQPKSPDKTQPAQERNAEQALRSKPRPLKDHPEIRMRRYRLEVGQRDAVRPENIVGAIANEADIESSYIGSIEIHADFSLVDLPDGMPAETFQALRKTWVCGKKLAISELGTRKTKKAKRKKPKQRKKPAGKS